MHLAFYDKDKAARGRDFTTADILAALPKVVPLSRSQRERIETLREWLRAGRAQSASYRETQTAEEHFVKLQLNN